jgi:dephospho-CoA kinase
MPGSGKSTAVEILTAQGLKKVSMGDALRNDMRKHGMTVDAKSLDEYALYVRQTYGDDYVLKLVAMEIAELLKSEDTILLDGVRHVKELNGLKSNSYKTVILGVIADRMVRYNRIIARHRESDIKTIEEFEWREEQQIKFGVPTVLAIADHYVQNNRGIEEFSKTLVELLTRIKTE